MRDYNNIFFGRKQQETERIADKTNAYLFKKGQNTVHWGLEQKIEQEKNDCKAAACVKHNVHGSVSEMIGV